MRRVREENILGLEVTMYDFMFFEEQQGVEKLFGESANEFQGEAAERVEFNEFVEVHG